VAGCGSKSVKASAQEEVVYVCTETHAAFVGTPRKVPAENPDTGRRTLMPALFNPAKSKWQAMPPLEVLDGNPGAAIARKADQPLTPDGPRDGLRQLPSARD
jgi:hypothetical protein